MSVRSTCCVTTCTDAGRGGVGAAPVEGYTRLQMAGSVVHTLPIVTILIVTERLVTEGLTDGADKG